MQNQPQNLKIFTGTWNCSECNPESEGMKLQYDFLWFLQFNKGEECDIYAIGLQGMFFARLEMGLDGIRII